MTTRSALRARAPLRVSFAGGGTDVPPFPAREGGVVLSATINRYAYATLRPARRRRHHGASLDFGTPSSSVSTSRSCSTGDSTSPRRPSPLRFRGRRRAAGFDLFLHTNAPPGSGLGSSSAMIVRGGTASRSPLRTRPSPTTRSPRSPVELEREDLGIRGGLQDQYAAAFGGFNFIEFHADRVVVNPLRVAARHPARARAQHAARVTPGRTRRSDHIIEDQVARFERQDPDALAGLRAQKDLAPCDEGGAAARGG